jgi:serine/threonine protein kinase
MGEVYEGCHTLTGKRVAIKCIAEPLVARGDAVERLAQEARGSGRVRHPNVVDVYDFILEGATAFLVMEYLDGETLTCALERGDLPPFRLVQLILAAMRGVAEAHRQGVIHRDIKPDNIFLAKLRDTELPIPKVLDFGICKLRAAQPSSLSLTASGHLMGTPLYMSLEQLESRNDLDGRVDVYAFGVTLYQALTGKLPFCGNTLPELIVRITSEQPIAPHILNAQIPRPLSLLVLWALKQQRDERIASLEAFVGELEPFTTENGYRNELAADHDEADLEPVAAPSVEPVRSARTKTAPSSPRVLGLRFTALVAPAAALLAFWLHSRLAPRFEAGDPRRSPGDVVSTQADRSAPGPSSNVTHAPLQTAAPLDASRPLALDPPREPPIATPVVHRSARTAMVRKKALVLDGGASPASAEGPSAEHNEAPAEPTPASNTTGRSEYLGTRGRPMTRDQF